MKFGLKTTFFIVTVFAMFLAIVVNENLWLGTATLGCFIGWFAVAKILQFVGIQAWDVLRLSVDRQSWVPLVRLTRTVPPLVVASVFTLMVIVLTNSVRTESLKVSGALVTVSILVVPVTWFAASIGKRRRGVA